MTEEVKIGIDQLINEYDSQFRKWLFDNISSA
jgi:hypothetical protein